MNEEKKYKTIKAVVDNGKSKKRANVELGLSIRQVNRLVKAYQGTGKAAFIHENRGKQSRNKVDEQTREQIIQIYLSFLTKPIFIKFIFLF